MHDLISVLRKRFSRSKLVRSGRVTQEVRQARSCSALNPNSWGNPPPHPPVCLLEPTFGTKAKNFTLARSPPQETKPHIQELSIKTTIISRYAFTAVYCAMLNRHSAASEGVFRFQIPANAYVSNFTM